MLSGWLGASATAGASSGLRDASPCGYAVVDLEATGSSPRRHRIVEVGVVLLDRDLRSQGEFSTLVDPLGPVGPTHIHGIGAGDVVGAPRFAEISWHLLGLLRGRVLVGHHVACDRGFLAAEFSRLGVDLPPVPTLCTMRLAADHLPGLASPSLRACCAAAGLPRFAPHTALGDARATAGLLRRYAALATGCSGRTRPAAWNQALSEAAGLRWPGRGAPGVPRGPGGAGSARNARGPVMVPTARKGDA
ncbi:DNA polymerase III subunit epsilon [Wenjunlia vitaminophila]|uniref:DNA polymerase III subunit epsilon n=1 Tax=Wenjunlia vitaminophila TaxID=76728 RepID=A0A0T6LXZ9_WENVI|nr:3'-5' exonuclease [Wenjunlia vitaminophila]KRV50922.1 DNA polymerase III subunit epsilon [Wenjunlia vitaminophila]